MRGSITAFLALSLALFLSAVFAFLEAGRVSGLKMNARLCTLQAADGLLAEYEPGVWKDYQVLFRRTGTGKKPQPKLLENRQEELIAGNFVSDSKGKKGIGSTFLTLTAWKVKADTYELASDHGGKPFLLQAARQAPLLFAESTIRTFSESAKQGKEDSISEEKVRQMEGRAEDSLTDLQNAYQETVKKQKEQEEKEKAERQKREQEEKAEKETGSKGESAKGADGNAKDSGDAAAAREAAAAARKAAADEKKRKKLLKENPITEMKKMKKSGILAQVMPDREISGKKIKTADVLSRRKRHEGNAPDQEKVKAQDKLLFRIYLNQKFRNAAEPADQGALAYEVEYILGGKASDEANLKSAVRKLLLLREGANYLALLKDAKRQAEATELALAIATAFLQPEMEELIKQGILLAWAYKESVHDVRSLLSGGKVPLIKTSAQWGKTCKKGLSYEHYLQILLTLGRDSVLAYRAMDLIEQKEDVRLDTMVARLDCSYEYQAEGLFSSWVWIGKTGSGIYRFREKQTLSYTG